MLRWDKKRGGSKIATPLLLRRAIKKGTTIPAAA